MPFIWKDKTYWNRFRESLRIELTIFFPMFFVSLLLWYLFLREGIQFFNLFLVSSISAAAVFTFLNIFLQFPNEKIPDYYPKWVKTLMYIFQFIVACFGLYIVLTKIIFVSSCHLS